MKNNSKILYAIIVFLLLIIVGAGAFWLGSNNKADNTKTNGQPVVNQSSGSQQSQQQDQLQNTQQTQQNLSEQPNQQKFNEYFTEAALAKLPAGAKFDPFSVKKTSTFNIGEQFCTTFTMKKQIVSGAMATAVYDVNAKQDVQPKMAIPRSMGSGGSVGCENLAWPVGKYEYKIYVNDVLAVVLPFEVK